MCSALHVCPNTMVGVTNGVLFLSTRVSLDNRCKKRNPLLSLYYDSSFV